MPAGIPGLAGQTRVLDPLPSAREFYRVILILLETISIIFAMLLEPESHSKLFMDAEDMRDSRQPSMKTLGFINPMAAAEPIPPVLFGC